MKLRVINVLKKWLQNHYYDFAEEKRVFKALSIFIEEKVARQLDSRWSASLRLIIQEKVIFPFFLLKYFHFYVSFLLNIVFFL